MKTLYINLIFILSLILCASCKNSTVSSSSDIPDPSLDEIAMMRADANWGTVVIYNPVTCKEIGDACGFFRLHAFSHSHLNHHLLSEPSAYPISQEMQADCWTAKYGKPNETKAAVKLLLDENRNSTLKIHGDPIKRAENIRSCAMEIGKWIEE